MPELVTLDVPATSLAKGDRIPNLGTVESTTCKVKYVHVKLEGVTRPTQLEMDQPVTVRRSQPTEAEKAAQRLDFQLHALDRAEQGAAIELAKAQAKVRDYLDKDFQLGYSETGDLFYAQANARLWYRVTQTARSAAQHAVEFDETTGTWSVLDAYADGQPIFSRLDAFEDVRKEVTTEVLEYASHTSRSTSVLSNAIENYEREAKARFVTKRGYWMF
jgi:hypothetical protein